MTRASSTADISSAASVPTRRPSRWASTAPSCSTSTRVESPATTTSGRNDAGLALRDVGRRAQPNEATSHRPGRRHRNVHLLPVADALGQLEAVHITPPHADSIIAAIDNISARSTSSASSAAASAASSLCLRSRPADAKSADRIASDWLSPVASRARSARCASSSSRTEIALVMTRRRPTPPSARRRAGRARVPSRERPSRGWWPEQRRHASPVAPPGPGATVRRIQAPRNGQRARRHPPGH